MPAIVSNPVVTETTCCIQLHPISNSRGFLSNSDTNDNKNSKKNEVEEKQIERQVVGKDSIYTWSHASRIGSTSQIHTIKTIKQLSNIMRSSSVKVKVLGRGLSYQAISSVDNDNNAILLDLSPISGLCSLNDNSATFGAGTSLKEVTDVLISLGRELECCPGVLLAQSVAGAIATGTHGQGLNMGGLSDAVSQLNVVMANGDIKNVTAGDGDLFRAFKLSLGCLGVITDVSFKTLPLRAYRCDKIVTDFQFLVGGSNFAELNRVNSHCKAWWFPMTDEVTLWISNPASSQESLSYKLNGSKLLELNRPNSSNPSTTTTITSSTIETANKFNEMLESLMDQMEKDTKAGSGREEDQFQTLDRFKSLNTCIGNLYQIWCKGIPVPQINCEIAVDLSDLPEALQALSNWHKSRTNSMHYPFILRCAGPSDCLLSASNPSGSDGSSSGEVCWIGFLIYLTPEYKPKTGGLELLREIESVLSAFRSRPHFGKFFSRDLYEFRNVFPGAERFEQIRNQVDPTGRFSNTFIDNILK